jgi:Tfp pilus assembly protein PilP
MPEAGSNGMLARRGDVKLAAIVISTALLLLVGCESNKIQPTSAEFDQERARLLERVEARKAKQNDPSHGKLAAVPSEAMMKGGLGGSAGFTYDMADKRDPFRSFEWERKKLENKGGGPLEQFDVSQLAVMAVVWQTGKARALVQDPGGESYIVGMGARIGKNEGIITRIDDNLITVRETYEDYLGQVTQKDIEMRIRLSDGG